MKVFIMGKLPANLMHQENIFMNMCNRNSGDTILIPSQAKAENPAFLCAAYEQ